MTTKPTVDSIVEEFAMLWHDAEGGVYVAPEDYEEYERIFRTQVSALLTSLVEEIEAGKNAKTRVPDNPWNTGYFEAKEEDIALIKARLPVETKNV